MEGEAMSAGKILVVGARQGSLGSVIKSVAEQLTFQVVTAGISGQEDRSLDAVNDRPNYLWEFMDEVRPNHVVCTTGINEARPEKPDGEQDHWYRRHFDANVIGPMRLLHAFKTHVKFHPERFSVDLGHYVAISSNSAFIPRTDSAAYCASKAALSQALRVEAREARGGDMGYIVYGYEPGWLKGTPMSQEVSSRFPMGLHRMRGQDLAEGVSTVALAAQIVTPLNMRGAALNGALIRYDGGEM